MKNTIVLFKGYNNHSNRLLQAIHLEAFCMEHNIRFYNPSFWKMSRLYNHPRSPLDALVWSVLCSLNKVRLLKRLKFRDETNHDQNANTLLRKKLVFVQGWWFRNYELTQKYRKKLVEKYALRHDLYVQNKLYNKVLSFDRNAFNLVGVHIRWGDYKTWRNGEFYYSIEVYQKYMKQLNAELLEASGKQTIFLIFSNEAVPMKESENILISKNPWYIDQQIMSLCDYLIGPPSTFTLWASYIGKAVYFQMKNDSGVVHLNDFQRCNG